MNSDQCRQLDAGLHDPNRPRSTTALKAWLESLPDIEGCIAEGLRRAREREDWLGFDLYALAAFYRPSRMYTEVLCGVLSQRRFDVTNENIVEALGESRDPAAVDCLRDALFWEPDWDEFRNLAVKCIWALAAIGTPDAIATIREVADSDSTEVREAARYELARLTR